MKIAITGKGGVGKTTVSSILSRLYADEGYRVLAVDADPDANLALALGFTKKEIDEKEFVGESSLVKITLLGTKEVKSVKIDSSSDLEKDDIEMLEDMIMVAFNDATKKIDEETEKKMGKFANIPGLF